jgi:hypothetical protein
MSVPENRESVSNLIPRALERASAIERGLMTEQLGVVQNLLAHFSLIPTHGSRPLIQPKRTRSVEG